MEKKKILIVEDENIVADDIKHTLINFGYEVIATVSSGEEAIKITDLTNPDLILMDIVLDGSKSGSEAAVEIKEKHQIPIIFLTAYVDEETLTNASKAQPYGYIIKPFEERELMATIQMAFHKVKMDKIISESEDKFKTLIVTMEEGLIIVDDDENFTYANPAAVKIFECDENELLKKNLRNFTSSQEFEKVLSHTKKRREGTSGTYELNIITKKGKPRILRVKASPLIVNKKYVGTFGLISDITREKQIDKSLRELKQAVETMQLGLTIADIHGKITFTNPADARIHGYTPEELIGKDVRIFAPIEIRKPVSLEEVKKWKGLVRESVNIRKDGSTFPVRLISDIVRDADGNPIAVITTCEDITKQKEAEKALRESEERFRSTFYHAAAGMVIIEPDGKIIQVNQSFCEMIGYSEKELLRKSITDLTHPDDVNSCLNNIENMLSGELEYFHQEERFLHKDGTVIWVNISVSAVSDDFGKSVYLIAQILDISEMRKVEEEIKALNRQLEQRVKIELKKRMQQQQLLIQKSKLESLGKLAAGIAHEINQPLAGISMSLDNILFNLSKKNFSEEYLRSKLDSVFKDIDRIRHIINHVRIFSRDQKSAVLEQVDVNEAILNALSMVKTQYQNNEINIELNLQENMNPTKGNKYKLEQVVLNILTNAKDALDEKSGSFRKEIKIRTFEKSGKIFMEITDNGIGISEDKMENIFDPFFTTKDPEKGTGLGLSIIYGIVREMKGEIDVESEVGKFTKFTVKLPRMAT